MKLVLAFLQEFNLRSTLFLTIVTSKISSSRCIFCCILESVICADETFQRVVTYPWYHQAVGPRLSSGLLLPICHLWISRTLSFLRLQVLFIHRISGWVNYSQCQVSAHSVHQWHIVPPTVLLLSTFSDIAQSVGNLWAFKMLVTRSGCCRKFGSSQGWVLNLGACKNDIQCCLCLCGLLGASDFCSGLMDLLLVIRRVIVG